ncbi:hypothetical protein M0813_18432 [Anaeramoeba flamelloides]|uniref:Uncharacterized protein n=1 Tax=Anaeramoeba flamelloides TaxID=1746091 RepID=A0AAV7Z179_9EUKA|nr:hypothetical protein M0812_19728 [Anaeramoeba flamelloides]KAJ6247797.1 hypothetical protein M0813_18432 [Anaeramoeba flamelloides]
MFIWVIIGVVWSNKSRSCGKLEFIVIVDSIVILSSVGLIVCGCFSYLIIQKKKPELQHKNNDKLMVTDPDSDSDYDSNSNLNSNHHSSSHLGSDYISDLGSNSSSVIGPSSN